MERVTLCTTCSALPFGEDDLPDLPDEKSQVLGILSDLRNKPTCSLCQLARFVVETDLSPYASTRPVFLKWYSSINFFMVNNLAHARFYIVQEPSVSESKHKMALQVTRSTLDLARARGWLDFCRQTHSECNELPIGSLDFFASGWLRLIDVISRCVVKLELPQRYIALSYVWGGAHNFRLTSHNLSALSQPGSLENIWSRIPRTIRDAFQVVQELGERYLWVDSLCLIQNDSDDMSEGIEVMDLIYESAVLTIVAASGSHADAGLPGAGSTSRIITQRIAQVTPGIKLACHLDLEHLLKESAYNQRGWTFQELILSRRALVFVDNQMYFRCATGCYSEDLIDPTGKHVTAHSSAVSSLLPLVTPLEKPCGDWEVILMYYSERTLSNQSDAQLAMAGIARRASQRMACKFLQGIPTATFDMFVIFYRSKSILRRRRGFPSYTWAGWIGRIECDAVSVEDVNGWLRDHTWIKWYKRRPNRAPTPVWDLAANKNFPVHDQNVHGYRERSPFGARHNVQSARTTPTRNLDIRHPPSYPMLQFWTLEVSFTLSEFNVFLGTASIFDSRGIKCGVINMDGFEDDEFFQPGSKYHFIVVSEVLVARNHVCAYSEVHGRESRAYNVLVLEWSGGVAERRGIGTLCRLAVERSLSPGPRWGEILLA